MRAETRRLDRDVGRSDGTRPPTIFRREAHDRRRRRVPRPARLRRAARRAGPRSRSTRSSCTTSTPSRSSASRRAATAWPPSTATSCRSAPPPTSTTPSRAPTSCSARSASARLEGRVVDEAVPLGARRARPGDHRPGRHLLRAAHDPGDGRARRDRSPSARRGAWLINFTNPAGHGHRGRPAGARRPRRSASATRRAASAGASPRALGRDARRAVVRLLRPQPPRLAAGGVATPTATGCPSCWPTTRRWPASRRAALFGGDWLRALGMIPNEYLYYFYFARRHGRRDPRSAQPRGAYLLEQQAAFYAGNGQDAGRGARRLARHPRRARPHLHGRGAQRRRASTAEHDDGGDGGGYEGEAMAVVEAIANNTRAIMILNTANRSALPFLDEHAVVEVPVHGRPQPARCRSRSAPSPPHAQALVTRSRTSSARRSRPRSPAPPSSPSTRSRCTRWCRRVDRGARDLRRLPRAAARAGGALRR